MKPGAYNPRAQLEERLRFETLLADLSSKFVNLPAGEVDREILDAERGLCEFLGIDFAALWQVSADAPDYFTVTHVYSLQRGSQQTLERMKVEDFPWFLQEMLADRIVNLPSLEAMPAEAAHDLESCRQLGIKSNLCLPLSVGGKPPFGIFGLNTTQAERGWPDAMVKRLQLVAQIFANALARKRADQVLSESEERMSLAGEAAEFGIWVWSISRNEVWGSERWLRLFGFASGEKLGLEKILQRIHPEDRETVEEQVRRAVANCGDYAGEFRVVLPDGTEGWIASRGRGYPNANGSAARMLGAAIDITKRKQTQAALAQLQKRNELILDSVAEGILGLDLQGNHMFVNPSAARMLGYEAEELLGRHSHSLWHHTRPDGSPYPEKECKICAGSVDGKVQRGSTEVFWRKDGTSFPIEYARTPIYEQGRLLGAVVTFEDITARKRAEDALRTSEARLAAGASLAGFGSYEIDYAGPSCFADERFGEICGVPPGTQPDLQRLQFWMEHLHPDDRQSVLDERQKVYGGKAEYYNVEYRYLHPTQGQKWIHHLSRMATRDATGRVIRIHGVVRDITERKQLSQWLQSAAEEWQATFDSISDLVMILDCDYHILQVNASTVRFFGLPRERIVGSTCFSLMHGTSCPVDGCPCQKTFQSKLGSELELFHAGSGKWLLFSTDPIRDTAGKVIGAVHAGRDITERKRAEEELQRLRLQLWHADRVAQTGAITASLAHELNQPLTGILSTAQAGLRFMAAGNPDPGEVHGILTNIVHDTKRAAAVINGLRAMLRRKETQRELITLADTIQEALNLLHSELVGRQVECRLHLQSDSPVLADKAQIQQVLLNLVMNALEAMQDQPADERRLELTLTRTDTGEALVALRDSGPGIPEPQQQKLFEGFWTTKQQGLGIGLSISRSIIESHGGRLWFANNPDRGGTFYFALPLTVY